MSNQFNSKDIQAAIDYIRGNIGISDLEGTTRSAVRSFINMDRNDMIQIDEQQPIRFQDLTEALDTDFTAVLNKRIDWDLNELQVEPDTSIQELLDELQEELDNSRDDRFVTDDKIEQQNELIDEVQENWQDIKTSLQQGDMVDAEQQLNVLTQDTANIETEMVEPFNTEFVTRSERENLVNYTEQILGGEELSRYDEELLWTRLEQRRLERSLFPDGNVQLDNPKPQFLQDWMDDLNLRDPRNIRDIERIERRLNTRVSDFTFEEARQIKQWVGVEQYKLNQNKLSAFGKDTYTADRTINSWLADKTVPDSEYSNLDIQIESEQPAPISEDPVVTTAEIEQNARGSRSNLQRDINDPITMATDEQKAMQDQLSGLISDAAEPRPDSRVIEPIEADPNATVDATPESGAQLEVNGQRMLIPEDRSAQLTDILRQYTPEELGPCVRLEGDQLRFDPSKLPDGGTSFMQSEFWSGAAELGGNILTMIAGAGIASGFQAASGFDDTDTALIFSTLNLFADAGVFSVGTTILANAMCLYNKYNHKNYIRQLNTHSEEHPLANRLALVRRNGKIYPALTRYVRRGDSADSQIMITYGTNPHMVRDATGNITWSFDKVLGNLDQSYFPEGFTLDGGGFDSAMGMKSLVDNPLSPFCILNDDEVSRYMDTIENWNTYLESISNGDRSVSPPEQTNKDVWGAVYNETELNDAIERNMMAKWNHLRFNPDSVDEKTYLEGYEPYNFYLNDQRIASGLDLYTDFLQQMSQHDPTLYDMQSYGQGFREQYYVDWDQHGDLHGDALGIGRNVDAIQDNYHTEWQLGYGTRRGMLERYKWMVGGVNEDDPGMLQRMQDNLTASYNMLPPMKRNLPMLGGQSIPRTYDALEQQVNQIYNLNTSWEAKNFLAQKAMYRYTLRTLCDSPFLEVRKQTQDFILDQVENTNRNGKHEPPLFYDYGEGNKMVPDWVYSEYDGHGDDGLPQFADTARSGGTHEHADMTQETYDRLNQDFRANNWLTRVTYDNVADLQNTDVQHMIHEGVDTTGDSPVPLAPTVKPSKVPETPITPEDHQNWSPTCPTHRSTQGICYDSK